MCTRTFLVLLSIFCARILGASLNAECQTDDNCGTLDSFCNNGTCICIENFKIHQDSCVQIITPRMSCIRSPDCHPILGPKSMCKGTYCACQQFHHEYNGQCVKNRDLLERCDNDSQCYRGQKMKYRIGCIDGICDCKEGFLPINNHRQCIGSHADVMSTSFAILTFTILVPRTLIIFS